jgi:cell fate (sporulation/competence/biofilm development) regulator YlbF (YheA/YmcA/DUF963 family)
VSVVVGAIPTPKRSVWRVMEALKDGAEVLKLLQRFQRLQIIIQKVQLLGCVCKRCKRCKRCKNREKRLLYYKTNKKTLRKGKRHNAVCDRIKSVN